ncbi:hypothetical protein SLS55_006299 [Diplodia seriata]|uniref:C2H2-type domain-containing protein n=1 Tax=Diplodia seriata TaxID=420778 RepID=A0ABR3CF31_9PEZI
MPPAVYWCPFCQDKLYKSKGNLNNHVMQDHEPQKQHYCHGCNRSWNIALGCTRHLRKSSCSSSNLETRHHESKKTLYACGICVRVFDDFSLRQDHLFAHQQEGAQRASWSMDNVMRSLLSYPSIADRWRAAVQRKSNNSMDVNSQWQPRWDWGNPQTGEVVTALEHTRFDSQQELDQLLDTSLSTLTSASEAQLRITGHEERPSLDAEVDFGAYPEEGLGSLLTRQLEEYF